MRMLAPLDFSLKSHLNEPESQSEICRAAIRFQTEISHGKRRFQTEISFPSLPNKIRNYIVSQWFKMVGLPRFHTEIGVSGSGCSRDFSLKSSKSKLFGTSQSGYSELPAPTDFSVKSSVSILVIKLSNSACADPVSTSPQLSTPHVNGVPYV